MKALYCVVLALLLSACGSTPKLSLNFSGYNHIIVNNFTNGVSESADNNNILSAGKKFADIVASKMKSKGAFDKIEQNIDSTDHALLIDGKITKYSEGSALKRAFIGMGAGRSYFAAIVVIKDNSTKRSLAEIDINEKSWAPGGVIAGMQDINSHMNAAANRIVDKFVTSQTK